ncbi:hypothetical protein N9Y92_00130 [Chlamydiales bacterium]|nr:hypothetical protein [Chlamydiales bacterium]
MCTNNVSGKDFVPQNFLQLGESPDIAESISEFFQAEPSLSKKQKKQLRNVKRYDEHKSEGAAVKKELSKTLTQFISTSIEAYIRRKVTKEGFEEEIKRFNIKKITESHKLKEGIVPVLTHAVVENLFDPESRNGMRFYKKLLPGLEKSGDTGFKEMDALLVQKYKHNPAKLKKVREILTVENFSIERLEEVLSRDSAKVLLKALIQPVIQAKVAVSDDSLSHYLEEIGEKFGINIEGLIFNQLHEGIMEKTILPLAGELVPLITDEITELLSRLDLTEVMESLLVGVNEHLEGVASSLSEKGQKELLINHLTQFLENFFTDELIEKVLKKLSEQELYKETIHDHFPAFEDLSPEKIKMTSPAVKKIVSAMIKKMLKDKDEKGNDLIDTLKEISSPESLKEMVTDTLLPTTLESMQTSFITSSLRSKPHALAIAIQTGDFDEIIQFVKNKYDPFVEKYELQEIHLTSEQVETICYQDIAEIKTFLSVSGLELHNSSLKQIRKGMAIYFETYPSTSSEQIGKLAKFSLSYFTTIFSKLPVEGLLSKQITPYLFPYTRDSRELASIVNRTLKTKFGDGHQIQFKKVDSFLFDPQEKSKTVEENYTKRIGEVASLLFGMMEDSVSKGAPLQKYFFHKILGKNTKKLTAIIYPLFDKYFGNAEKNATLFYRIASTFLNEATKAINPQREAIEVKGSLAERVRLEVVNPPAPLVAVNPLHQLLIDIISKEVKNGVNASQYLPEKQLLSVALTQLIKEDKRLFLQNFVKQEDRQMLRRILNRTKPEDIREGILEVMDSIEIPGFSKNKQDTKMALLSGKVLEVVVYVIGKKVSQNLDQIEIPGLIDQLIRNFDQHIQTYANFKAAMQRDPHPPQEDAQEKVIESLYKANPNTNSVIKDYIANKDEKDVLFAKFYRKHVETLVNTLLTEDVYTEIIDLLCEQKNALLAITEGDILASSLVEGLFSDQKQSKELLMPLIKEAEKDVIQVAGKALSNTVSNQLLRSEKLYKILLDDIAPVVNTQIKKQLISEIISAHKDELYLGITAATYTDDELYSMILPWYNSARGVNAKLDHATLKPLVIEVIRDIRSRGFDAYFKPIVVDEEFKEAGNLVKNFAFVFSDKQMFRYLDGPIKGLLGDNKWVNDQLSNLILKMLSQYRDPNTAKSEVKAALINLLTEYKKTMDMEKKETKLDENAIEKKVHENASESVNILYDYLYYLSRDSYLAKGSLALFKKQTNLEDYLANIIHQLFKYDTLNLAIGSDVVDLALAEFSRVMVESPPHEELDSGT